MKPNIYKILTECIERGASYGVMRAFKHTDNPGYDNIAEAVENAIMNEICEHFTFDEDRDT